MYQPWIRQWHPIQEKQSLEVGFRGGQGTLSVKTQWTKSGDIQLIDTRMTLVAIIYGNDNWSISNRQRPETLKETRGPFNFKRNHVN